jgi:peptidyl-prolyl cis-trans isomerase B (cyclophilin B)
VKGTLSMARGENPGSADMSFFIVLGPSPVLDGKYTAFGRVVEGIQVVEAIEQVPVNGESPVTRIEVRRVTVEKK